MPSKRGPSSATPLRASRFSLPVCYLTKVTRPKNSGAWKSTLSDFEGFHWLYWKLVCPPRRWRLRRQSSPGLGGVFLATWENAAKGMATSRVQRLSVSESSLSVPTIEVAIRMSGSQETLLPGPSGCWKSRDMPLTFISILK